MIVDSQKLADFLLETGVQPEKVERAVALVERLFWLAEGRRELLSPADATTEAVILEVLQGVFGEEEIKKIVLVSKSHPFSKPEWMTEIAYNQAVKQSLEDTLGNTLGTALRDRLMAKFCVELRDTLVAVPEEKLWSVVGGILMALGAMLGGTLRALGTVLFFYLHFLLAGDGHEDQVAKLERWLEIDVKGWVPLGFKKDEPTTMTVMVA